MLLCFLVFCIVVGLLVYFLNKKGSTSLTAETSSPLGYILNARRVKSKVLI